MGRVAYLEGWKAIAAELKRSTRWCKYTASRPSNPLPAFKVGGIVRLNLADLDAWLERQRVAAFVARSAAAVTRPRIEEHW